MVQRLQLTREAGGAATKPAPFPATPKRRPLGADMPEQPSWESQW